MPIVIPKSLPAFDILKKENVFVMPKLRAMTQDIRPIEIAIVNLMPTKIETETQLMRLLGNSSLQVNVTLINTDTYKSKNTPLAHMQKFYKTFDEIKDLHFDGMIITGAPVETMPFEQVAYWEELEKIMDYTENNDVNMLILQFFDQYADEVRRHMEYENRYVFSYVEAILGNSEPTSSFSMTTFASRHKQLDGHHIEAKLTELKNIIIKYYPAKAYNNLLNSVLFDIFSCEKELAMHCLLEDFLLVPAVLRFEKENRR